MIQLPKVRKGFNLNSKQDKIIDKIDRLIKNLEKVQKEEDQSSSNTCAVITKHENIVTDTSEAESSYIYIYIYKEKE